jgi:hypothetical protein
MERVKERTYWCGACSQALRISAADRPVEMLSAGSGRQNVHVVTVAGVEVHRCALSDSRGIRA